MSPKSKEEYTAIMAKRYKKIKKRNQKNLILDEYCRITGYHRKHAIRKLNNFAFYVKPKRKKPGKPSRYNKPEILMPLKTIWLQANLPCSKNLKSIIPLWLPHYAETYAPLDLKVIKALKSISPATIDRTLKPIGLNLKNAAYLVQNQDLFYVNKSPSRQINGMNLIPDVLKPTPFTIVANQLKANTPLLLTSRS